MVEFGELIAGETATAVTDLLDDPNWVAEMVDPTYRQAQTRTDFQTVAAQCKRCCRPDSVVLLSSTR